MCLYTNRKKPVIAQKDIKVYKHVAEIHPARKEAKTPCQGSWFNLNQEFIAMPEQTDISRADSSLYQIEGGVIHACLWPDFSRGRCLEAYIPKGTEYWYGIDKSTICAKKLFITDKEIDRESFNGLDEDIARSVYDNAPCNNGIKIGDFLVYDDYVRPFVAAGSPKNTIKGIVIGFNGSKPLVADFQNITLAVIDRECSSRLHKYVPNRTDAMNDMDGYEHFQEWKNVADIEDKNRYSAYHAIKKLGDEYYIPALGEMEMLWHNLICIAASLSIAHLYCPFTMQGWYWTSTECSQRSSWGSSLRCKGGRRVWDGKFCQGRVVPFVASAKKKKMIINIKLTR